MKPAFSSCCTTMYSEPWVNLTLRTSSLSRSVRLSSYGCMGRCVRYDSTASASRLLTFRLVAIQVLLCRYCAGAALPVPMGLAVRVGNRARGGARSRVDQAPLGEHR